MSEATTDVRNEATREAIWGELRRLLNEDPISANIEALRTWVKQSIEAVRLVAETEDQSDVKQSWLTDTGNYELQANALRGVREADDAAWQHVIGGLKDLMSEVLHDPEQAQVAA